MAEINTDKGGGGKGKPKKMSTKVDLTPMVDLGFLLITFFLLATTMIKPQTMELIMPAKEDKTQKTDDGPVAKASRVITIVMDKDNKLYYWQATQKETETPVVVESNYSSNGLRKYLIERNLGVMSKIRELDKEKLSKHMPDSTYKRKKLELQSEKGEKNRISPIILIKPTNEASYKNMIDVLDEMAICNIGTFAITDITPADLKLVASKQK